MSSADQLLFVLDHRWCVQKHGNGADTYLHRVGRAGRFGTKGLAITFVASEADSEVLNKVRTLFATGHQGCVGWLSWR